MRSKILPLLLIFSTALSAQNDYQYVFQQYHGQVNDIAVDDARLLVGGNEGDCKNPFVALMNRDGSLAWKVSPFDECGYCWVTDIAFTRNGNILLGGHNKVADDTGTPVDGFAVARLDTLGNRLAYRHFFPYHFYDPVHILELPDATVIAGGNRYLFGFSPELDSLFKKTYDFDWNEALVSIEILNDSSLVLMTQFRVLLTDLQGEIQEEIPAPASMNLIDLKVSGDSLLLMSSGVLYFYNLSTADLSFVTLPQTAKKGILLHQDTIMIWGEAVHRLDENSEWQMLVEPYSNQKVNLTMTYKNGIIYRGGAAIMEPDEGRPSYYRIFQDAFVERIVTFANPPQPVKDLGITSVDDLELISYSVQAEGPDLYLNHYYIRFGIEVTNFSDAPVYSFIVGSEVLGSFNCSEGRFFTIDGTTLLPGESTIVEGMLSEVRYTFSPNPTVTFERCFFVGAPDHKFDANFDNNYSCDIIFVDTREVTADLNLHLYPNPATDLLQVEVNPEYPIEAYAWINAAGQVISQLSITPTDRLELQRPGSAGMYFLKLVSKGQTVVERIIWQ